jgi:2-aminomuconate deaminase
MSRTKPKRDSDPMVISVSYDIVEQCRSVFENIRFILEDAGSSWDRIVDVTAFLTDMNDFAAYNKVYAEHFPPENRPSRTTVEVSRLPTPIAVELKVIATID